jgi:hypothetical protein
LSIILTSSVLITWLALAAAFCAIGGLLLHRIGYLDSTFEHLYFSIWAGLALTIAALLLWHFVLPIRVAQGAFAVLALAAVLVERRWFRPLLQLGSHLPFALGALALVAWTANHSLAAGGMDDYNYEFQAVRWFVEHPIVPGLANLHGRLGFNNSHHLLAALLSAGPWEGQVNHIVNGFLVSLVLVYVLFALVKVASSRGRPPAKWLFASVLAAPAVGLVLFGVFGPAISTLKADVFISAGVIFLSCVFVRFASAAADTPEYRVSAATTLLVGCLMATVKLSAATFCSVIVVAVLVRLALDARKSLREPFSRRLVVSVAAVSGLLLAGFLVRGFVLSGYPLYPSTLLGLDVDWQVPVVQAQADRVFIKTWSQLRPTYDMAAAANQDWVKGWLNSLILTEKLTTVLPLVLITVLSSGTMRKEGADPVAGTGQWALVVLWAASMLALAVWLTQAPAARFGSIYFWIPLAATVVAVVGRGTPASGAGRLMTVAIVCAALAVFAVSMLLRYSQVQALHHPGVFAVVIFAALWAIALLTASHRPRVLLALCVALGISQIGERTAAHALRGRTADILSMIWHDVGALPEAPVFEHAVRQTRSGLTIHVSRSSSFHTPIPNTRYFNPYLELRTPGDVRGGFRNPAGGAVGHGYKVDYIMQPNAGTEIIVPAGE